MRKHELPFKVLAAQQAELARLREENERLNQLILYWEEETADAKRVRDGWIDQAEAAEAKWAMLTANQAGHPAMCCGQCHQAIVDAEAKLALREDHDAELTRLREENERLKNPAYIFNEHAAAIERAEAAEAKLAEALYEMTAAWGGHTDPHTVGEMARAICDEMKAVREEIARETNFKQLAYAREEAAEAKLALLRYREQKRVRNTPVSAENGQPSIPDKP